MTDSEPLCFVLMWFDPSRKIVYNFAIKPAAESCGYKVLRADELHGPYAIIDEVIEHIFDAEILIADLTGSRPNVFYEMGISHVPGNKTILICDASDWKSIPFDARGLNVLQYEMTGDGLVVCQPSIDG